MWIYRRRKNSQNYVNAINVTPIVDVMLVLLVIFMATAPVLKQGIDVSLPKVDGKKINVPDSNNLLDLTISRDKRFFLQGNAVDYRYLGAKLSGLYKANPKVQITIKADEKLSYGYVLEILDLVYKAGISNVAFIAENTSKEVSK